MPAFTAFNSAVQGVLDRANSLAGNSTLSWVDFGQLYDQLKIVAVEAAKDLALQGYQKKQFVLDALDKFIDAYLPLPAWLFFLRSPVKKILLQLADGAIEALYQKLIKPTPTQTPEPTT
jgi:hypothetical protein